jgi:hypothetical protein
MDTILFETQEYTKERSVLLGMNSMVAAEE